MSRNDRVYEITLDGEVAVSAIYSYKEALLERRRLQAAHPNSVVKINTVRL